MQKKRRIIIIHLLLYYHISATFEGFTARLCLGGRGEHPEMETKEAHSCGRAIAG
jgi:hypothetical protein